MGCRTVVHIYNDALHELEENSKQFVDGITEKTHNGGEIAVGCHANAARVMRSVHDSTFEVFIAKDGCFINACKFDPQTKEWLKSARLRKLIKGYAERAAEEIQILQKAIKEIELHTLSEDTIITCVHEGTREPHTCPYRVDIHSDASLCQCCEMCEDECSADI